MKKYFITTPIYYPNDIPHIGSAYSSVIADVYARFKRLLGYEVKFSTGTDENSQKIVLKAQEKNMDVMDFLDDFAGKHEQMRKDLRISYTDFIRTTQPNHKEFVQSVLKKVYEKDLNKPESERDIYLGNYEGLYCVGCEEFKKDLDLIEKDGKKVCPDHLTPPQIIQEKNRFFRLKKYVPALEKFFSENPEFVKPGYRFNEVKAYLNSGVEDFSISRQNTEFGIPLPRDEKSITYVRFDALLNYLTVCQTTGQEEFANEMHHVIGKNIAKFHVLYRPAMLMAADLPLPKSEIINGFLTIDGQKISKSLGNVINPVDLCNEYDRDAMVFYFFYDLIIGSDGDFSRERFKSMYDSMLIGGRGNLVSRVTKLAEKNGVTKGKVNESILQERTNNRGEVNQLLKIFTNDYSLEDGFAKGIEEKYLNTVDLKSYLMDRYSIIQFANEYMQKSEPRTKIKNGQIEEGKADLEFLLYIIKNLALLSSPFLINGFEKIQAIFGNDELSSINSENRSENFANVFDMKEFSVNLKPDNIYSKAEPKA